jgi:outer membrane protein
MNKSFLLLFFKKEALALLLLPLSAQAETLSDALRSTYETNPVLLSQQATQRATDETYVQARAGWRPTISVTVSGGYTQATNSPVDYTAGTYEANAGQAAINLTQPLYTGGRVGHAVQAAQARVLAGQQGLRVTEAQVFQTAIQAYVDVLENQDVLGVRQADLATLSRQVTETSARYRLGGAVTRTDVAQAEAQRAQAQAALAAATAQLDASRSAYRAATGHSPGALIQPAALPGLPASLPSALQAAAAANPALAQSALLASASAADIATARAARLPTVGLQGSFGTIGGLAPFHTRNYDNEATALVTLTQPIVAGGLVASQIRQAEDKHEADTQTEAAAARTTEQNVETAWSAVAAGRQAVAANEAQVQAASIALRGYQLEYEDGLRTTLDVLIADQNLRAAQVALAQSRHDTILAEASLLSAIGRLEARVLLPDAAAYDPSAHFQAVKDRGRLPWDAALDR